MQKPLTFLAPVLIAASLAMPAAAQDETTIDTVVATVGDTEITIGHMIAARASLPEQYQQLPDEVLFSGILDQLVQQSALAQTYDGDLPSRVRIQLENERRSLTAGEVIEGLMAQPLGEEDVQAAYEEQYSTAEPSQEFNASHILVETEEEAITIKEELDGGADFEGVAREKSTGPSGPGGGSLGWFGPGMMVPEFEAAVAAMEAGQISAPVKTQFGWHVIKLNETRVKDAPPLDEVREEIELQVRQTNAQATIEAVAAEAEVDRSGAEGIDPAILKQVELLE